MTVTSQPPLNRHTANGATTVFAYQFKIVDEDHLAVYTDDTLVTSGYTISGVNDEDGGSVTFSVAPASGVQVSLIREIPAERTLFDYQNSGDFRAATVNADYDLIWQYLQQIASDLVSRAVLFSATLDRSSNTNQIPTPENGKFLTWNAAGELVNASGTGADDGLREDIAQNTGASLMGYKSYGTDAVDATVEAILDNFVFSDGYPDLATAVAAVTDNGGTVYVNEDFTLNDTVIIPSGVTVDMQWHTCMPGTTSLDCFIVRPGGQLKNPKFNAEQSATGLGAYTGKFVTLQGTGAGNGFQGTVYRNPWLSNYAGRIDLNQDSGEHIYLDGSDQYLQEFIAENISCRGGARGVHVYGDDPSNLDYAQGNVFVGATMHGVRRFIHCEGEGSSGNVFSGFELQQRNANPVCEVVIEGSQNVLTGVGWDDIGIVVSGDGNDLSGFLCTGEFGPSFTDTGRNNRGKSRGVSYYDKTSINTDDDFRRDIRGPGKIEFRDFILGGIDPRWSTASAGTASVAFSFDTYGAATGYKYSASSMHVSLPANSDSYKWYFAGNRFIKSAQNPKVHFTIYTPVASDGRLGWEAGLYGGANDYIILRQSFATYGDGYIRLICRTGGVETVTILLNASSGNNASTNRVYVCSLLITESSVTGKVKEYNNVGIGSSGRVSDGVLWQNTVSNLFTAECSTNIPVTDPMEPYVYCLRSSGGSTGNFFLLDYQLVAADKSAS